MSYAGKHMLNWVLRQTAPPPPPQCWLSLFTKSGEVSGGGYARVNVSGYFSAPDELDEVSNLSRIDFPTPTENWGTLVGGGVFSEATDGEALFSFSFKESPPTANAGAPVYFLPGTLEVSVVLKEA